MHARTHAGVGEGVLPNYSEYASGMWSWDTYKQAVGMALWAPELAKNQLRLLVHGRDYQVRAVQLYVHCVQLCAAVGRPTTSY
eukprot:SAG22_NODE_2453_length_2555_cov_2.839577_3_plen_83_part_00